MRSLPRAMPALITPFNRSGDLDLAGHRNNVGLAWDAGLRGLLIGGTTGEGPYLEVGERRDLVAAARQTAPGALILCGVHAESSRQALGMVREAADGGADAALVLTPTTLVRQRADLIEAFFTELAETASLPLLLYTFPRLTGLELSLDQVARLSLLERVVGIKDSGGDPVRAERLVAGSPPDFAVFCGSSAAVTMSISAGAHGAMTASANYAPHLVRNTVTAARRSVASARSLQQRLSRAATAIESFGTAGTKYAASRIGMAAGPPRRPLEPLPPAARAKIRRVLHDAGLG